MVGNSPIGILSKREKECLWCAESYTFQKYSSRMDICDPHKNRPQRRGHLYFLTWSLPLW
jgi:hypothetical protein